MLPPPERTGVIIIRVWRSDIEEGFRARVTTVRDLESDEVDNAVAASVDAILEIVQRFVSEFNEN